MGRGLYEGEAKFRVDLSHPVVTLEDVRQWSRVVNASRSEGRKYLRQNLGDQATVYGTHRS